MRSLPLCVAALFLAASAGIVRADAIDNPAYMSWSKCKPGSCIVLKSNDGDHHTVLTETLVEVGADKCVVRFDMTVDDKPYPSNTQDVDHQITDPDEIKQLQDEMAKSDDQTLTTPAGTFKCKHVKLPLEDNDTMEVWYSQDVPGTNIKSIHVSGELHTTETIELQSVSKK